MKSSKQIVLFTFLLSVFLISFTYDSSQPIVTFQGTVLDEEGNGIYCRMIISDPITHRTINNENNIQDGTFEFEIEPGFYNIYLRPYKPGITPTEIKNYDLTNSQQNATLVWVNNGNESVLKGAQFQDLVIVNDGTSATTLISQLLPEIDMTQVERIYWIDEFGYFNHKINDRGEYKFELLFNGQDYETRQIVSDISRVYSKISNFFPIFFQIEYADNSEKFINVKNIRIIGLVQPGLIPAPRYAQFSDSVFISDDFINVISPRLERNEILELLGEIYGNQFDFVNIFETTQLEGSNFHSAIQNDVMGFGRDIFDRTIEAGAGRMPDLLGYNFFPNLNSEPPLNHEIIHQWSNFAFELFNASEFRFHLGYCSVSEYFENGVGYHGGFALDKFQEIDDSTVVINQNVAAFGHAKDKQIYSDLELYFMGALPFENLQDTFITLIHPEKIAQDTYRVSAIQKFHKQQIVYSYGERPYEPNREYKIANIIITDEQMNDESKIFFQYIIQGWNGQTDNIPKSFEEAARGLASVSTSLPNINGDMDQDGFDLSEDCDDNNSLVNPDARELPYNGMDDDCNPLTLDDDLDQDGFDKIDDCDDNDPNVNSGNLTNNAHSECGFMYPVWIPNNSNLLSEFDEVGDYLKKLDGGKNHTFVFRSGNKVPTRIGASLVYSVDEIKQIINIGLNNSCLSRKLNQIPYSFYLQQEHDSQMQVNIFENGVNIGKVATVYEGDVLSIIRVMDYPYNGKILWLINDQIKHISSSPVLDCLFLEAGIYSNDGAINGIKLSRNWSNTSAYNPCGMN